MDILRILPNDNNWFSDSMPHKFVGLPSPAIVSRINFFFSHYETNRFLAMLMFLLEYTVLCRNFMSFIEISELTFSRLKRHISDSIESIDQNPRFLCNFIVSGPTEFVCMQDPLFHKNRQDWVANMNNILEV